MREFIILLILAGTVSISGCNKDNERMTKKREMKTQCLEGVVYYSYAQRIDYAGCGYMSPKFNKNGTIATCDN